MTARYPALRQFAPEFLTLTNPELEGLYNKAKGNRLAFELYLRLAGRAVFKGPNKGCVEGVLGTPLTYGWLEAILRGTQPEKGQWPAGPTVKQIRTALDVLEAAGLLRRDAESNRAQGQLRMFLPHRADGSAAERAQLRRTAPRKPTATERDARALLKTATDSMRASARPKGQRAS